jgi:hypothetical protein
MKDFREMVELMVATAKSELIVESALEETQYHKAVDRLAEMHELNKVHMAQENNTYRKVMGGYDSRYMDRNDFRFASKVNFIDENRKGNDEYFDYLLASQGIDESVREKKVVTSSYDFDLASIGLEWKKVAKKATPSKASVRKVKGSLPTASYLPSQPSASTTQYNAYEILRQEDGKWIPVHTESATFYKVLGYKVYKQAVVIDYIPADEMTSSRYFDDAVLGLQKEGIDHSRDDEEVNRIVSHLIFKYNPLKPNGKPNPYCGFTQLNRWLHSQKFITSQYPHTLGEALDILNGSVVCFPRTFAYNYTAKADSFSVFTVFGDIESLVERWESSPASYTPISEFIEKDDESDEVEVIAPEVYGASFKPYHITIAYECHKEFLEPFPIGYSHISAIFD